MAGGRATQEVGGCEDVERDAADGDDGVDGAAAVYAYRTKQPEGRILNVPYDFRMPTMERLRRRVWNPDEPRVFTPTIFGVGWSLNFFQLVRQLRGDAPPKDPPPDDGVV